MGGEKLVKGTGDYVTFKLPNTAWHNDKPDAISDILYLDGELHRGFSVGWRHRRHRCTAVVLPPDLHIRYVILHKVAPP